MSTRTPWARRLLCLALVGLIGAIQLPAEGATDEERAAARSLAKQGASAFEQKKYSEAVDLFSRAESLVHSPVHLLFLARAHKELGQLVKAQEAYVRIGRERLEANAPKVFVDTQRDAARELGELEPRLASLTVTIAGVPSKDVTLTMDGAAVSAALVGVPMPVDPGTHELSASAEGTTSASQTITLGEGEKDSLKFELVPLPGYVPPKEDPPKDTGTPGTAPQEEPSRALGYAGWASLGLGVIGGGVSILLYFDSEDIQKNADSRSSACPRPCLDPEASAINDLDEQAAGQRTNAAVVGSIGGALVVTGVILLLVDASSDSSATAPRVSPWVGWNAAGVSGSF